MKVSIFWKLYLDAYADQEYILIESHVGNGVTFGKEDHGEGNMHGFSSSWLPA